MVTFLWAALALDFILGDPRWMPHPTRLIGWLISFLERLLRPLAGGRERRELLAGTLLVILVVASSYAAGWGLLYLAGILWAPLRMVMAVWLVATTIAPRSLWDEGKKVAKSILGGRLDEARTRVGMLVGRDTATMGSAEVCRAAVETVAENTGDGVVAPLFYAALGGPPLALAYRAVNTLDSMLGYRDPRYLYFGRAAARLDDLANLVPSRLSGMLITVAAAFLGHNFRGAWRVMGEDARRHPSPNSGYPEAAVAGALGVRLGGVNYYHGVPSIRAHMGSRNSAPPGPHHILDTGRLMWGAALLFMGIVTLVFKWIPDAFFVP